MTDSNEVYRDDIKDNLTEIERSQVEFEGNEEYSQSHDVPVESSLQSEEALTSPVENILKEEAESDVLDKVTCEKDDNTSVFIKTLLTSTDTPKTSQEVCEKLNNEGYSLASKQELVSESCDQFVHPKLLSEVESDKVESGVSSKSETMGIVASGQGDKENPTPDPLRPPSFRVAESFAESSRSSSSELQPDVPCETSNSSQENTFGDKRLNFENAIHPESSEDWKKEDNPTVNEESGLEAGMSNSVEQRQGSEQTGKETPLGIDETTQQSSTNAEESSCVTNTPSSMETVFPISLPPNDGALCDMLNGKSEVKTEPPPPEPPAPVVPPAPRKRGRPRKQVLPNPSPLVESWGSNAQEFPAADQPKERKRSTRTERRTTKRKKFEDEQGQDGDEETPKRRFNLKQPVKKKKRRATYTPKKRGPPPKKKHSEMENIQNFEEETRMSASEGHGGFSSKSGGIGDESQGSSVTEGMTKSNINKKGRMEVMTDGCKPVTVQQIVEYYWPPPSSLPHGEKPEGLMIQEQITEYLGVKSFKRKYPSIKRRPVDMEERNYLQENGFVSENMCDMGLTAVFSADIIEIMYNDFPQKFEEYRKYTREKKAKEQRALREKQAAERADLDPMKEAVESTVSWNSEFNKTRRFKVVHPCAESRVFTDGMPCPPFERVVINHAPNNTALCVEDEHWTMTLFCYECEISGHTRIDKQKQHMGQNLWMFLVGSVK